MRFEFATADRIIFGPGSINEIIDIAPSLGKRCLVVTGKPTARAQDSIAWIQELCAFMKVPSLFSIGISQENFPAIVAKARRASSMRGNPIVLTDDELTEILERAK